MHILMISLDADLLSRRIGNAIERHEHYAELLGGRISMAICNRRGPAPLGEHRSDRLIAQATDSRNYAGYVLDGYRLGLRLHAEQPVDAIASQDPFLTALIGLMLRRRLRVPLIVQDHSSFLGSPYFTRERRRNALLKLMARLTVPRADAVRVVNRRERLACIRLGIPADRVCVIPVGIDLAPFAAPAPPEQLAAWRARLEIGLETPLVLWVGRPVAFKNLPLLLLAFKQVRAILPSARLALVGDMGGTNIPGQIAAHGLQDVVRLPGPVPHAELPALYQTATIYALSSDYEGLGRVLMEAGAAGLAVASTHTHGAADVIVPNLTGLLTPIGDAEALAEAMLRLLRNPARRRAIGQKAQAHVLAAFDYEVLAGRWAGMLRHVARREPPCES